MPITTRTHTYKFVQAEKKFGFEDCKDVVYYVLFAGCGLRYLGDMGQHFYERRKQHECDIRNRKTTNRFYGHSKGKVGQESDWSGTVFVVKGKHRRARWIKQAILSNAITQ